MPGGSQSRRTQLFEGAAHALPAGGMVHQRSSMPTPGLPQEHEAVKVLARTPLS